MVEIDEKILAGMLCALTSYKFKLCEPPRHDGRQDVWLAACARRDAQLECVKKLLSLSIGLTKAQPSKEVIKAFS